MKLLLWVLDINDEIRDETPEIHLWGLDDKGHRILVVDKGFKPHFYLIPNEKAEENSVP